jgi:hypothetical protein
LALWERLHLNKCTGKSVKNLKVDKIIGQEILNYILPSKSYFNGAYKAAGVGPSHDIDISGKTFQK